MPRSPKKYEDGSIAQGFSQHSIPGGPEISHQYIQIHPRSFLKTSSFSERDCDSFEHEGDSQSPKNDDYPKPNPINASKCLVFMFTFSHASLF